MEEIRVQKEWAPVLGRVIKAVRRNDAKDLIELETEQGTVIYLSATGDCCSSSWFEHLAGVDALIGEKVLRVVEREMPGCLTDGKDEHGEDHESLQYYGWTLETAKGRCDLEMRNSSNGYYGGSIEIGAAPLDQYGQRREDEKAPIQVTEDF